nr:MAG TPA: methyltransferase [Caudoviricetes sp.]
MRTREGERDILDKLKLFIQQETGYTIPDGIKLERKVIKHIFENHGYDTEL